jgi:hypothetical protein
MDEQGEAQSGGGNRAAVADGGGAADAQIARWTPAGSRRRGGAR